MSRTDHHAPRRVRERSEPWYRLRPYRSGPPDWYRKMCYTGPERQRVRAACERARAEHRAGQEPATEPPVNQHRHAALWVWC